MQSERRSFLKIVLGWGALAFTGILFAEDKKASLPGGKSPVSEADAVASSLGYKHDVKNLDYKKFPQRKKAEAKNQFCDNCMFYTKLDDKWGNCQVIQSGAVSAKGWCMSWAKKS